MIRAPCADATLAEGPPAGAATSKSSAAQPRPPRPARGAPRRHRRSARRAPAARPASCRGSSAAGVAEDRKRRPAGSVRAHHLGLDHQRDLAGAHVQREPEALALREGSAGLDAHAAEGQIPPDQHARRIVSHRDDAAREGMAGGLAPLGGAPVCRRLGRPGPARAAGCAQLAGPRAYRRSWRSLSGSRMRLEGDAELELAGARGRQRTTSPCSARAARRGSGARCAARATRRRDQAAPRSESSRSARGAAASARGSGSAADAHALGAAPLGPRERVLDQQPERRRGDRPAHDPLTPSWCRRRPARVPAPRPRSSASPGERARGRGRARAGVATPDQGRARSARGRPTRSAKSRPPSRSAQRRRARRRG
jgi:hypothetical protein